MSTKKTVDYVAERVASCCVKYIRNNLLSVERKKNLEALNTILKDKYKDKLEQDSSFLKV